MTIASQDDEKVNTLVKSRMRFTEEAMGRTFYEETNGLGRSHKLGFER
jgi:hypothetical protein